MTRINHHALGASRRLPPRITLLASSTKFKFKEERKRILKLSVKKLRSIEDPEAFLSKSVLINNTLKRLQTEVREEKAERKKCAELPDYNPSPYSFYSIEKAYREEMERLDNNGNNPDSTSSFGAAAAAAAAAALSANHQAHSNNSSTNSEPSAYVSLHAQTCDDQHMLDADDEDSGSGADSSTSSTSGDSSSSEDEECEEISDTISDRCARIEESSSSSLASAVSLSQSASSMTSSSPSNENSPNSAVSINEINSVEDDLLSEVYMPTPSMPPPHDPIDDHGSGLEPCTLGVPMRPSTPVPWSSNNPNKLSVGGVSKLLTNPSAEAVIKSSEISGCDNEDIWSEAVRTECWTKPVDTPAPSSVSIRTTLTASSTVNTNSMSHHWPSVDWPTYTPSTGGPCSAASESAGPASSAPIAALSASSASNNSAVATSASNFNPNISALPVSLQCANSHKENLFSATVHTTSSNQNLASNHHNQNSSALDSCDNRSKANPSQTHSTSAPSSLSDKCYSCGQSSLFQSELQSVVFSSLIASLET